MGKDSSSLIFTRKVGLFKWLMWVGEMRLNKQTEVEDGGWSSRTVCKYQSTEEEQQLCVCGQRRSWQHPRGLYVFHAVCLPTTVTWQNHALDTLYVIFISGQCDTRSRARQCGNTYLLPQQSQQLRAFYDPCVSLCVTSLRVLVSQLDSPDNLVIWSSTLSLYSGPTRTRVCPVPQCRITSRRKLNYPKKQILLDGSAFLKKTLVT